MLYASDTVAPYRPAPGYGPSPLPGLIRPPSFPTSLLLVALGAAGMFFGQPNTVAHLPLLVLLFPFCLHILALSAPSGKDALARCFLLALAANCAGLYWIVYPMHDVAGAPFPGAAICVVLLSAYLGCFTALTGLGMRRVGEFLSGMGATGRKNAPATLPVWPALLAPVLSGLIFGGFEVISGFLFTGFPWLSLSSAFAFWPAWVQAASITGSYGLSALYASASCLLAAAVLAPSVKTRALAAIMGLAVCAALPLYGARRLAAPPPDSGGQELSLLMIQGNIDQNQKWDPVFLQQTLDSYLNLSYGALRDIRDTEGEDALPDLVIWPETAMPFYFQTHREHAAALRRFAITTNVHFLFGALGVEQDESGNNSLRNRLYLLSPSGDITGWYDKRHLVPFGEYTPFAADIPFLRKLLQGFDFSGGTGRQEALRLDLPAKTRPSRADAFSDAPPNKGLFLGPLICYEAIFPYLAQEQVEKGASVLITLSNDAWFRQSSAPWQHLSLTVMRALEQARPIARSTNTGVSAIIDSRGRVLRHGENLFTTDTLKAVITASDERTVYHRLHPVPQVVLALLALFSLLGRKVNFASGQSTPR